MRLSIVALATAFAFVVPAATAAPGGSCTVVSDPAGDVTFSGLVPVAQETHLDVRSVDVASVGSSLLFRIHDTDLMERRLGEWRLTFQAGPTKLFVNAGTGMWLNVGTYRGAFGFQAGVVGKSAVRVEGAFDYVANEIRVLVPNAAFAGAIDRRGRALTHFAITAKESFASVAPDAPASAQIPLVDVGRGNSRYVVGRAC